SCRQTSLLGGPHIPQAASGEPWISPLTSPFCALCRCALVGVPMPGSAFKPLPVRSPEAWRVPVAARMIDCILDTGVQAIQLSPCRPGLDKHTNKRVHRILPFRVCYFPLRLSPSGKPGGLGVSRSAPPAFRGDQRRRTATHIMLYCRGLPAHI